MKNEKNISVVRRAVDFAIVGFLIGGVLTAGVVWATHSFMSGLGREWCYSTLTYDDYTTCDKPVIYLYGYEDEAVNVKLDFNGDLTTTYPKYDNTEDNSDSDEGWNVTAHEDGTLTDKDGMDYNYLYWEGISNNDSTAADLDTGYCVKREETADFLETKLAELGLTRKEANEFIVYWLPILEENEYNIISFDNSNYIESAELIVDNKPDTEIRVYMTAKASDNFVEIEEPDTESITQTRSGKTLVEWGGEIIK